MTSLQRAVTGRILEGTAKPITEKTHTDMPQDPYTGVYFSVDISEGSEPGTLDVIAEADPDGNDALLLGDYTVALTQKRCDRVTKTYDTDEEVCRWIGFVFGPDVVPDLDFSRISPDW